MSITHIKELRPDPRNARKHNPRNIGMISDAMQEVGAARSVVIDEDNVILAGNGAIEAAAQAGITKVQVVEADGNTIIAVRRTNLTPAQKQRLALFDNRAAETADWDIEILKQLEVEGVDLGNLWSADELAALLQSFNVTESDAPELRDGDRQPYQQMAFTLHDDQVEEVKAAIAKAKQQGGGDSADNANSNGNALAFICTEFNRG